MSLNGAETRVRGSRWPAPDVVAAPLSHSGYTRQLSVHVVATGPAHRIRVIALRLHPASAALLLPYIPRPA